MWLISAVWQYVLGWGVRKRVPANTAMASCHFPFVMEPCCIPYQRTPHLAQGLMGIFFITWGMLDDDIRSGLEVMCVPIVCTVMLAVVIFCYEVYDLQLCTHSGLWCHVLWYTVPWQRMDEGVSKTFCVKISITGLSWKFLLKFSTAWIKLSMRITVITRK